MRRQGLREECGKGDTHFPNHQGADAAPRSPRCSRPAPGSGCSCPAARPPSAHLRVTSLRERWPCAGPEGILVWFSPGRAYPMFATMPAAPAWALPPVHTPNQMARLSAPQLLVGSRARGRPGLGGGELGPGAAPISSCGGGTASAFPRPCSMPAHLGPPPLLPNLGLGNQRRKLQQLLSRRDGSVGLRGPGLGRGTLRSARPPT